MLSSNLEARLPEDKVEQQTAKTKKNRSRISKHVSKLAAENVRMKHTVPCHLPLQLKSVLHVELIILWLNPMTVTVMNKSSNTNGAHHPSTTKQNQVFLNSVVPPTAWY